MLAAIRHGGRNPYPATFGTATIDAGGSDGPKHVQWEGEVVCGHNPWLAARIARVWPLTDGSGGIGWEDDPRRARDDDQGISERLLLRSSAPLGGPATHLTGSGA